MDNVTITFLGMKPDGSVNAAIQRWAGRLEEVAMGLAHCEVTVARGGRAFEVDLEVEVAGIRIVARRDPARALAHEDIYVAVSDAFRTAWHQMRTRLALGTQPSHRAA